MKRESRDIPFACPIEATLGLIGGKWKTLILDNLTDGTLRFGELQKCMPRITPKMLTQQLRACFQACLSCRAAEGGVRIDRIWTDRPSDFDGNA